MIIQVTSNQSFALAGDEEHGSDRLADAKVVTLLTDQSIRRMG